MTACRVTRSDAGSRESIWVLPRVSAASRWLLLRSSRSAPLPRNGRYEELLDLTFEGVRESDESAQGEVPLPALDRAKVRRIHPRVFSQDILGHRRVFAHFRDTATDLQHDLLGFEHAPEHASVASRETDGMSPVSAKRWCVTALLTNGATEEDAKAGGGE